MSSLFAHSLGSNLISSCPNPRTVRRHSIDDCNGLFCLQIAFMSGGVLNVLSRAIVLDEIRRSIELPIAMHARISSRSLDLALISLYA
jgi:hypothetical protein